MEGLLVVAGIGLVLVNIVCWIIILVNAWEDEVWKALLGFLFWPYLLYFAVVEFDHDQKWLIVLGWLGAGIIGGILLAVASVGL